MPAVVGRPPEVPEGLQVVAGPHQHRRGRHTGEGDPSPVAGGAGVRPRRWPGRPASVAVRAAARVARRCGWSRPSRPGRPGGTARRAPARAAIPSVTSRSSTSTTASCTSSAASSSLSARPVAMQPPTVPCARRVLGCSRRAASRTTSGASSLSASCCSVTIAPIRSASPVPGPDAVEVERLQVHHLDLLGRRIGVEPGAAGEHDRVGSLEHLERLRHGRGSPVRRHRHHVASLASSRPRAAEAKVHPTPAEPPVLAGPTAVVARHLAVRPFTTGVHPIVRAITAF